MHNFLLLLSNEGKQTSTFNNDTSVHSNKLTVINIFEEKNVRQKPTLYIKPDILIKFFQTNRLLWLNSRVWREHLASQFSWVSFGGGLENSNGEKTGEATEGRVSGVKCREALLEWRGRGLWRSCATLHVWCYDRNCEIHLSEYLINSWLDFVTKLQKCTSFGYSWSTS